MLNVDKLALNKDEYYFLSPWGLGDTMFLCGFKKEIENKLNAKVNFIIKPSHEVVLKMYNNNDYQILCFSKDDIEEYCRENTKMEKGKIWVAHPWFNGQKEILDEFTDFKIDFLSFYKKFLGLDINAEFEFLSNYPDISEQTRVVIEKIAPLDKIVLFAPEATSVPNIDNKYYQKLARKYKRQGYACISNVTNIKNVIKGTKYLDLSISDAVALAVRCKRVISVMSGFCDLIMKRADLTILYPSQESFYLYSLKRTFNDFETLEEIIEPKYVTKCYKLFSILPLLKVKESRYKNKTRYYLFNFIPLLTIKNDW